MRSFKRTEREMAQLNPPSTPNTSNPQSTATAEPPPSSTHSNMQPHGTASSAHVNMPRPEHAHGANVSPDHYFRFTDKHQQLLLANARRQASALVVDTLYDTGKWKFLTEIKATSCLQSSSDTVKVLDHHAPAQRALEVYELAPHALHHVSCVAPRLASDPQQLALRSHTLLAKTRVRARLDDFMAWMSSRRRVVHQGMMNTLHEGHLQHCDVFSSFDAENPQNPKDLEQFAIKYFVIEPSVSSSAELMRVNPNPLASSSSSMASTISSSAVHTSSTSASTSASMSSSKRAFGFLRRKASGEIPDSVAQAPPHPQQQQFQQQQQQRMMMMQSSTHASKVPEERVHICHGEYSTIRHGIIRPSVASAATAVPVDHRIGIITLHSIEDPELLQLCNSVAARTTPRSLSQSTSRTLMQYSGIVAYPVVDEGEDEAYLEVIIKLSCFDPRGLTQQKKVSMFSYIAAFRNLAHMMLVMRLRASPFLTATHWVADERRKCCLVCQQRFSSLRRRHHCRLCGEVTCSRCSAVHQVRLVRDARASLRICLLCVQGVEMPKGRVDESESSSGGAVALVENVLPEHVHRQEPLRHQKSKSVSASEDEDNDEDRGSEGVDDQPDVESEPAFLLDFSLIKELSKPPSPTSTATDTSSPVDQLMESHNSSLASTVETESSVLAQSTVSAFHDSAYGMTFEEKGPVVHRSKAIMVPEDVASLHDSMVDFHDDESDGDEDQDEEEHQVQPQYDVYEVEPVSEVEDEDEEEEEEDDRFEMSRIVSADASEQEDDEDKRLQCLLAYRLLNDDESGVIPEDLTLQIIIKEAAQFLDCAIAAISFVDASRDMVTATYSASPLCQVSRGVIPKQHSLSWQVMERSLQQQSHGRAEDGDEEENIKDCVVVLDTWKDPTLRKSPFVLDEPYVRFMVGLPIRSWNGVPIGAMMIADIQPRTEISHRELLSLKSHVALVESWLANRRQDGMLRSRSVSGGVIGGATSTSTNMEDRLAEMLCTSYKTTLQMRGLQQKQLPKMQQPKQTTTSTQHIQRVLF